MKGAIGRVFARVCDLLLWRKLEGVGMRCRLTLAILNHIYIYMYISNIKCNSSSVQSDKGSACFNTRAERLNQPRSRI